MSSNKSQMKSISEYSKIVQSVTSNESNYIDAMIERLQDLKKKV